MGRIRDYAPDALVVSLGVDTFEEDPTSKFKLKHDDYSTMGAIIAAGGLPTLFVMEGGYAVDALGINAVNVLTGFEGARSEEHTSELQSLMRISYAVFCLTKQKVQNEEH